MGKNDLKRKLNRGIDQLSDNIELKEINMEELQPLSEAELDDLMRNHEKNMKAGNGSYRILAAVVSLIVVITGFLIYFGTTATYSKVEIVGIPTLTIYMKNSQVVKIKAMNRESESIIDGIKVDQPLSDVLDDLFLRMEENGYIDDENNLEISIQGRDKEELEREVLVKAKSVLRQKASDHVSVNHKKVKNNNQQKELSSSQDAENAETTTETGDTPIADMETESQSQVPEEQKEKGTGSDEKTIMEEEGADLNTDITQENTPQEDTSQAGEKEPNIDDSENDTVNQSSDNTENQSSKKNKKKKRKKKRKSRKKKNKKKKTTRNKEKGIIINNVTNENETDGMNNTESDSLSIGNTAVENNVEN